MANPHPAHPIVVRGKPVASADAAVIALHGRDRDPADILSVCSRIGGSDLAWLAPTAANASWYPFGFMDVIEKNEPWLSRSLERVDTLVRELLAQGCGRQQIVLLGFSQGACVVAEYALRHPRRYGGLLIFTGAAIGPAGTRWDYQGDFAGTPALVSGSQDDEWVPCARMHETARLLQSKGAQVTEHFYPGGAHGVNDDEISIARRLLELLKRRNHEETRPSAPTRTS